MIDINDVVTLTYPSKPASPSTVTVTVVAPDGTVTGPTAALSGSYSFTAMQAGRHTVVWLSTGPSDSYSDTFNVSASSGSIISLADAKAHLRVTLSSNDEELRGFLAAVTELIEFEVGAVVPRTVVEVMGCVNSIVLKQSPVISVASMLTQQGADLMPYFNLDGPAGMLQLVPTAVGYPFAYRPYNFPGQPLDRLYYAGLLPFYQGQPVTITYKAGRPAVPGVIQAAARVTLEHLWESRRLAGAKPASGDGDEVAPGGFGYALPPQAVSLLASLPKAPVVG